MADKVVIRIDGDTSGYERSLKSLSGLTSGAMKLVTGALVAGDSAIARLGAIGLKYNADMESYTTNFEVMLGDQEKAIAKVEELKQFAAKTPFEMTDLANATQTLLSFGVANEDTMGIMQMLGDVSLGNKEKFNSLAVVYGQIRYTGKLMGGDLLQLINAGFNPLQVISEKTGKSMAELKEQMSAGAISADMVTEAFKTVTEEGGRFHGGMDKASQTTKGLISTLKDAAVSKFGEAMEVVSEKLKEVLPQVIEFVENFDMKGLTESSINLINAITTMLPLVTGLATAFFAFKTTMDITNVFAEFSKRAGEATDTISDLTKWLGREGLEGALLEGKLSLSFFEAIVGVLTGKISLATAVQSAWNLAMSANPIGLIVTIILTLIAVIGTLILTNEKFRKGFMAGVKAIGDGLAWLEDLFLKFIDWTKATWGKLKDYLSEPFEAFWGYMGSLDDDIKEWINEKVKIFQDKVEDFKNIGKDIVEGIWEGITSMDDWIIGKIKDFSKGIADAFKDFFGIKSPSKLFRLFGIFMGQGLGQGIDKSTGEVIKKAENQANKIAEVYEIKSPSFKSSISAVKDGVTSVIKGIIPSVSMQNKGNTISQTQVEGDNFYITVETDNIEDLNDLIRISKEAKRKERMGGEVYA